MPVTVRLDGDALMRQINRSVVQLILLWAFCSTAWANQVAGGVNLTPNMSPHGAQSVAVSRNGTIGAVGSSDFGIQVWYLPNARLLRTIDFKGATQVTLSSDGSLLAAVSTNNVVGIFDLGTGQEVQSFEAAEVSADSLTFGPNDRSVLFSDEGFTKSLAVHTGEVSRLRQVGEGALASVGNDGVIDIVDIGPRRISVMRGQNSKRLDIPIAGAEYARVSADHSRLLAGGQQRAVLWDLATNSLVRKLTSDRAMFSADGKAVYVFDHRELHVLRASDGELLKSALVGPATPIDPASNPTVDVAATAAAPNSAEILWADGDGGARLWQDPLTPNPIRLGSDVIHPAGLSFLPDGKGVLIGSTSAALGTWDLTTGEFRRSTDQRSGAAFPSISWSGHLIASVSGNGSVLIDTFPIGSAQPVEVSKVFSIQDTQTDGSRRIMALSESRRKLYVKLDRDVVSIDIDAPQKQTSIYYDLGSESSSCCIAISPDESQLAVVSNGDGPILLIDAASGALLKRLGRPTGENDTVYNVTAVQFSKDGRQLFFANQDDFWAVVDISSTTISFRQSVGFRVGVLLPEHKGAISGDNDGNLSYWDAASNEVIKWRAHEDPVTGLDVSSDGLTAISVGLDGKIKLWSVRRQTLLATLVIGQNGEWLTITPAGYFMSSSAGTDLVSVVKDLEAFSFDHFYEQLARQDLVRELLTGDVDGTYADAASKLQLATILNSGSVPQITLLSKKTETAGDTARITVRIVDTGGGIASKVVWRVNGQTQGDNTTPSPSPEGFVDMTASLRLDPSKPNIIDVTAYNGAGLLRSDTLSLKVDAFGVTKSGGPRLVVLAIGVGAYPLERYRLDFPEVDARAIAQSLAVTGRGLFAEVLPTVLTGQEVTRAGIDAAFNRMNISVRPTDVFVLFLSGHGETKLGRYYYIPQNFDPSQGDTWENKWIGQDQWEAWLRGISAEKQLLILDTCEGGSALGLVRGLPERETAMDQLRYATGRSIIAAAANDARESTQLGHGVLTYAILQALDLPSAGSPADRKAVTAFTLAEYAQQEVLSIRKKIWGEPVGTINRLTDSDFPLGFRASLNLTLVNIQTADKAARYVAIRDEQVRSIPDGPTVTREIEAGTEVVVLAFDGKWAKIAKDGIVFGFVQTASLVKVK
ncbi:MAG: hypothetical protein E5W97_29500 [Mesorhizobium sp.]|nr:MAG: hypothetical protein E5V41_03685 [Mesorhizobium sp.]TJW00623.1 MAG: hypothetical protein E5W97_29500 [Mesorhizobium sp.]